MNRAWLRWLVVVLAFAAVSALAPAALPAQALTGAGATFPFPLYSKWFDVYQRQKGVAINYQSIGSGAGIQQVRAGTVDFGASDAALSDSALAAMPRAVLHVPTVAGAIALAYNVPGVSTGLRLTPELVAGIWLGTITSWNDRAIAAVNPGLGLPAAPILAVHRADGSGTTGIFTRYLCAVSPAWRTRVGTGPAVSWPGHGVGGKGNDGVAGIVRQTPGAIGYVELAFAKHNQLDVALLRNRSGRFVAATTAATTAAVRGASAALARDVRAPIVDSAAPDAYPIAGLTFLLVYRDGREAARAKTLADFLAWAIHDGQQYAEGLDYAALPPELVRVNETTLRQLTANGRRLAAGR